VEANVFRGRKEREAPLTHCCTCFKAENILLMVQRGPLKDKKVKKLNRWCLKCIHPSSFNIKLISEEHRLYWFYHHDEIVFSRRRSQHLVASTLTEQAFSQSTETLS